MYENSNTINSDGFVDLFDDESVLVPSMDFSVFLDLAQHYSVDNHSPVNVDIVASDRRLFNNNVTNHQDYTRTAYIPIRQPDYKLRSRSTTLHRTPKKPPKYSERKT